VFSAACRAVIATDEFATCALLARRRDETPARRLRCCRHAVVMIWSSSGDICLSRWRRQLEREQAGGGEDTEMMDAER